MLLSAYWIVLAYGTQSTSWVDKLGLEMTDEEKREAISEAHMPTVLASRIEVRPIQKSMLVAIEFEDSDEEFAQKIVNAVAEPIKSKILHTKRKQ